MCIYIISGIILKIKELKKKDKLYKNKLKEITVNMFTKYKKAKHF